MGYTPEQVQDFYPTPGSLSTTMYYTGINPLTEEKVYIPKDQKEKECKGHYYSSLFMITMIS